MMSLTVSFTGVLLLADKKSSLASYPVECGVDTSSFGHAMAELILYHIVKSVPLRYPIALS
jgi:hypothetical protein